ncbi:hypothetical protein Hanom_Chr09g00849181 [Helianthus anomalus]
MNFYFFERQIWITDVLFEYHRATSGTTRSYPSPLHIMSIHQFRRKHNKYGKNYTVGKMSQIYKIFIFIYLFVRNVSQKILSFLFYFFVRKIPQNYKVLLFFFCRKSVKNILIFYLFTEMCQKCQN